MAHPILRYIIKHPTATRGVKHEHRTLLRGRAIVCAWTDGSQRAADKKTAYAFHFGTHQQYQHAQPLEKETLVFVAELHGAVGALLLHDPEVDFCLFTDCEAVWRVLMNPDAYLLKMPMERDLIQAVIDVRRYRASLGRNTEFHHIYSHLLDKPSEQLTEEQRTRYDRMKQRWGQDTDFILRMNQRADELAKNALDAKYPGLIHDTPGMPVVGG